MVFSGLCKLVLTPFRVFELPRSQSYLASPPKVEINYTMTWQCDMMSSENSNDQPEPQPIVSPEGTFGGEAHKLVNDVLTVKPSKPIGGSGLLVSSFVATTAIYYNWLMHTIYHQTQKPPRTVRWQEATEAPEIGVWEVLHEPVAGIDDWVLLEESTRTTSQPAVKLHFDLSCRQPMVFPKETNLPLIITPDDSGWLKIETPTQLQRPAAEMRCRQQKENTRLKKLKGQVLNVVRETQLTLSVAAELLIQAARYFQLRHNVYGHRAKIGFGRF